MTNLSDLTTDQLRHIISIKQRTLQFAWPMQASVIAGMMASVLAG
jgi:hypothetical protein